MNSRALTSTVAAPSLRGFLSEAESIGECFRCLSPLTGDDDYSVFAQILPYRASVQAVGGVLCGCCATSWVEWRSRGLEPTICDECQEGEGGT